MKNDFSSNVFIVVAGNIGSGKTTLTEKLANTFGWIPHYEPVDENPYLVDFYSDMKRWSFPLQIYFLTHRYNVHKKIIESSSSSIQDRSIYENANIFARALFDDKALDQRDYDNYLTLYTSMTRDLPGPTLVIYLKRSLDKLQERIKLRGREFEQKIDPHYLDRLNFYYDEWYDQYSIGKKCVIETDDLDLLESQNDFSALTQLIYEQLGQGDLFYNLSKLHLSEKKDHKILI